MKRWILFILAVLFLFSGVSPVYASSNNLNTENVNIVINGETVTAERFSVWDNARLLVPARTVFAKLGASVDWYDKTGQIKINNGTKRLTMFVGDRNLKINNTYIKMDASPCLYNGVVMIPLRHAAEALKASVNWNGDSRSVTVNNRKMPIVTSRSDEGNKHVVVIDPGHGGSEPGARYGGIAEKDLNLAIAKELNKLLSEAGIKTYMTRNNDTYVGLYQRSSFANKLNADLLISIHNNADRSRGIKGSMSLYYPLGGNSNGNLSAKTFANIVQNKLTGELNTGDLGIIPRPYLAVLRTAKMPSVIAEVGYMSNQNELKKLKTVSFKQSAAEALKKAVLEALSKI
jgi:N-acetylmuramoyl-L-alanine amidase